MNEQNWLKVVGLALLAITLSWGFAPASLPFAATAAAGEEEGEEVRRTEWHRIVVWNKAADIVKQHVSKGDALYVEGKISTNSWDDKEGNKHYSTEVICDNFLFLSPKGNGQTEELG